MKKLLSVAMCLALGLAVTGCETPGTEENDDGVVVNTEMDTPAVEVNVDDGGAAVEIVLPPETVEKIEAAMEEEMPMMEEEMPMMEEEMPMMEEEMPMMEEEMPME